MAQIQHIGSGSTSTLSGTSIAVPMPTNQARDLVLVTIIVENNADIMSSVPSGWTQVLNATVGTRAIRLYVYRRISGGSEPATYTWSISSAREIIGISSVYRGVNQASPIGNTSVSTSTISSASATAPSIDIQHAGNAIAHIAANCYGTTWTPPSPWSERQDRRTSTGSTNISSCLSDFFTTGAGATGDITATAANADYRIAAMVEIQADYISGAGAIGSGEAAGTPGKIVGKVLAAGAIASLMAFGTPKISGVMRPWGNIETGEAIGSAKLKGTISAGGISSAESFGSLSVKPVTSSLSPDGIAGAEAFGTTVLTGYKRCGAIPSKEEFGTPNVRDSVKVTSAGAIGSAEAFGSISVVKASWKLCGGIVSAEAFGDTSVVAGTPGVREVGDIASAEAFGTAVLRGPLAVSGIASEEGFGIHWVFRRDYCGNIASEEAFGTAALIDKSPTAVKSVGAIASAEALGAVKLLGIIGPPVIPTGYVSGNAQLNGQIRDAGGIAAPAAYGFSKINGHIQSISGIASAEAFGLHKVSPVIVGKITGAGGTVSEETFGTPLIQGTIVPSGIATAETVPELAVKIGKVRPDSIASEEAFGTARLNGQIIAVGIATSEAVSSLASVVDYVITDIEILELVSDMFTDIELVSGIYDEIELSSDIGGD